MILDQFKLDGKTAIVTGCRRGIGKGIAIGLAQAGADIIGVSVTPSADSAQKTPKVCKVTGIAPIGMDIHEQTAITAANMAMSTSSFVVNLFVFFFKTA